MLHVVPRGSEIDGDQTVAAEKRPERLQDGRVKPRCHRSPNCLDGLPRAGKCVFREAADGSENRFERVPESAEERAPAGENALDRVPRPGEVPAEHRLDGREDPGDRVENGLEIRGGHVPNGFDHFPRIAEITAEDRYQRLKCSLDTFPDGCKERDGKVPHGLDCTPKRCKIRLCKVPRSFSQLPAGPQSLTDRAADLLHIWQHGSFEKVGDYLGHRLDLFPRCDRCRREGSRHKLRDLARRVCAYLLYRFPRRAQKAGYGVPRLANGAGRIAPKLVPARAKPAEENVGHAFERVEHGREVAGDQIPVPAENLIDAAPYAIPVSCEYAGEHVEKPGQNVESSAQPHADRLKCSLENRREHFTKAVPHGFQYLGYARKLEAELVQSVGDTLPEGVKL